MISAESKGGLVIRRARLRAGLTQNELATRLRTSQPLIARWEGGHVEPGFATVIKAVRACGLDLAVSLVEYDHDHDSLIKQNLELTPTQRLRKMYVQRQGFERLAERKT